MPLIIPDCSQLMPLSQETFNRLLTISTTPGRLTGTMSRFDWASAQSEALSNIHPEDDHSMMNALQRRDEKLGYFFDLTQPSVVDTVGEWYSAHFVHVELDGLCRRVLRNADMTLQVDLVPTEDGFIPELYGQNFLDGMPRHRILHEVSTPLRFASSDLPVQTRGVPPYDEAFVRRALSSFRETLDPQGRYDFFSLIYYCLSFPGLILLPGSYRLSVLANTQHSVTLSDQRISYLPADIVHLDLGNCGCLNQLFNEHRSAFLRLTVQDVCNALKMTPPDLQTVRRFAWQRYCVN